MHLEAFTMPLKEICLAKHKMLCSHVFLQQTSSDATKESGKQVVGPVSTQALVDWRLGE
jgi:hypothetical protein